MRVLVDTNVFLDFLLRRSPHYDDVRGFFSYFLGQGHQIVISPMSFRDIEYVLRKVEPDSAKRKHILRTIHSSVYKVLDLSPDDIINDLFEDYKDFEDGLLIESAKRRKLDGIVTSNVHDFVGYGLPVYRPKELTDILQTKEQSSSAR